jgi:hypothetical protein
MVQPTGNSAASVVELPTTGDVAAELDPFMTDEERRNPRW